MTILSIETSTKVCSAALSVNGENIAYCIDEESANHSKLLPVFLEELLKEARDRGLKIDAVSLSEGPGSYTGLRIGASTAKGLCYGLQVPMIPVPTLEILCAGAATKIGNVDCLLCPMIDARRMEVYTALYKMSGDGVFNLEEDVESRIVENGEWLEKTGKQVYYFGDGARKCQTVLTSDRFCIVDGIVPDARMMGKLAEQKVSKIENGPELAYYEPFYLKEFVAAPSHIKGLK